MKTVAIYARVSTKDKQEVENQLTQLRAYCTKQKFKIVHEYVDKESGRSSDRTEFKKLFLHAHQQQFDAVLFWALDRFSREGVRETLNHLNTLEAYGVDFISYQEAYLNTLGDFRDAVIGILASLAKQEVARHSERTRAGLQTARARGKKLGRPSLSTQKINEIKKLSREKITQREIARKLGIDPKSVRNVLKK